MDCIIRTVQAKRQSWGVLKEKSVNKICWLWFFFSLRHEYEIELKDYTNSLETDEVRSIRVPLFSQCHCIFFIQGINVGGEKKRTRNYTLVDVKVALWAERVSQICSHCQNRITQFLDNHTTKNQTTKIIMIYTQGGKNFKNLIRS